MTDVEFLEIAQALQNNTISVSDLSWNVGDSRQITVDSFTYYSGTSQSVHEYSTKIQSADLVILHKQSDGVCANKEFTDGNIPSFIIGFKDNICSSYGNRDFAKYPSTYLRKVEDNIFTALPSEYRQAFKMFTLPEISPSSGPGSGGGNVTNEVVICSPAEREIFGDSAGEDNGGRSTMAEYNALGAGSQFDYYKNAEHRIHTKYADSFGCEWFERSTISPYFCVVSTDGSMGANFMYGDNGVSPYGCI